LFSFIAKLFITLSNDFLNDLSAVFSFFEQFVNHALTDDNVKLIVQKSDHVILINDEMLIEKVKKLLNMIFIQKSRSINCIKCRCHITEMKMFFTHTIDLLFDNMSNFVYERCVIITS
jgi:hypothetical protein